MPRPPDAPRAPRLALASMLLAGAWPAAADPACGSTASCNRLGTAALAAERFTEAQALFAAQVDFAETALRNADPGQDASALRHAREIAVNNAALAALRQGQCGWARAWLSVADPDHRATRANRQQFEHDCPAAASAPAFTGDYRQYAGHGAWNDIQVRATGDETLQLSAFWMRVGAGPLQAYGPAAFGELPQAFVHVDGFEGRGTFDGLEAEIACRLLVRFAGDQLTIAVSEQPTCQTGGAGAVLHGRYWRVGDARPEPVDGD